MDVVGIGLILTALVVFFLVTLFGKDDNDDDPY